ncbi:unnamed protein product [Brassicogethes aeneus]|uniref:UBX domain-containing protein n=1 Tax=Brassicogethes aeneus TaxID=1431903 RepID=A0A9P0FC11_BRAAE|nr:unnamed protein product [Brassicogethes aeneus]
MSSVIVLAPNGRRQTVKCTPNTTILQILEEVCKKQGLKSEEYDIKHHNKVLDTTSTFRFSGLPNNASLELCEIVKIRKESDITLALNLENGTRLMGNFNPNETLSNILKQLCPENATPDKNPVVIYTRREIYGGDLEKTTLKSLGLTGGRAMIRLMNKAPEELKQQANVSAPLPSKPVEEKPYRSRNLQKSESPFEKSEPMDTSQPSTNKQINKTQEEQPKPEIKPQKYEKNPNTDILKLAKERKKSMERTAGTLENKTENKRVINSVNVSQCECKNNQKMEVDCSLRCTKECSNAEATTNLIEDDFVFLGTRNAMLFSLETANAVPPEELPDDFYDLTLDDAKKILRDVKRKRFDMENTPLKTSALRNLDDSKQQLRNLSRYKKAIIRVQFPDRTVLQGTFLPTDSIQSVVDFVREFVEEKSLNFYVYTSPPKLILDSTKRLIEVGCVPGALLYFGTHEEIKQEEYLRHDLRNKFTTSSVASLAATKIRTANTRNTCTAMEEDDFDVDENTSPEPGVNDGASTSSGITHQPTAAQENYGKKVLKTTENVPKWFKPSK